VITDERSRSLSAHWPGLAGFFGHWLAVVLVIFQRHLADYPTAVASGFIAGTAPV